MDPIKLDIDEEGKNFIEMEHQIQDLTNPDQYFTFYILVTYEGSTKKLKFYTEDELKERARLED